MDQTLFDQAEQAERWLNLHLPVRHDIRGFEPERKPELALREAIVNALVHRDYTIGSPILPPPKRPEHGSNGQGERMNADAFKTDPTAV